MKIINTSVCEGGYSLPSFALSPNEKIRVAILDSGFDKSQFPSIPILSAKSFVSESPFTDFNGHGTSMLRYFLHLLAPTNRSTELIIGQTINRYGMGTIEEMQLALEWLYSLRPHIVLIPSGFIHPPHTIYPTICQLKESFQTQFIASVGNMFLNKKQPLYPAIWKEVCAVGGASDLGEYLSWDVQPDYVVDFSGIRELKSMEWEESTSAACMILGGMICKQAIFNRKTSKILQ